MSEKNDWKTTFRNQNLTTKGIVAVLLGAVLLGVAGWITNHVTGGLDSAISHPKKSLTVSVAIDDPEAARAQREAICPTFIIPRDSSQVPVPTLDSTLHGWANKVGAVDYQDTILQLTIEGHSDSAIVLQGLRAVVQRRGMPAPGNLFNVVEGCGSAVSSRDFVINLDERQPLVVPLKPTEPGQEIINFPYKVSKLDPEVFNIFAHTDNSDVQWYLELDYTENGKTEKSIIADNGRALRTSTSEPNVRRYSVDENTGGWTTPAN